MRDPPSAYYPPRARWHSRFYYWSRALRQLMRIDSIRLPGPLTFGRLIICLILPGYVFGLFDRERIGRLLALSYGMAALIFVVWIGYAAANLAAAYMLSLHAASFLFVLRAWELRLNFVQNLLLSSATLLLLAFCLYLPVQRQIERRCLVPLRVGDRVVVIDRLAAARSVQRGDWIAYRTEANAWDRVVVAAGYGLKRVQGMPGDEVRITPDHCLVNGKIGPRLANMPKEAEWIVPQKHWFIWPEFGISSHGVAGQEIAAAMERHAFVPESNFIGKPFRRWFWRRQLDL